MRRQERIPIHDHADLNSGGRVAQSTIVAVLDTGSTGGTGTTIAALDDIPDVNTTGVADGDALTYDSGTSTWVAAAVAGGTGSPSSSVTDETTWGITPAAGTASAYSRGDHTHGSPADPGSGGGALTYIGSTALGSDGTTISYSSIPGSYKDLIVVARLRGTSASAGIGSTLRVGNGSVDTGSNYGFVHRYVGWTTGTSNNTGTTSMNTGTMPNSGATSGFWGYATVEILNYASTSVSRGFLGRSMSQDGSGVLMTDMIGHWKNTSAAIDIITFTASTGNFLTGSTIYLYGRS